MKTKIEAVKTYWVGMSPEQLLELKAAVLIALNNNRELIAGNSESVDIMGDVETEALDSLREALLNV